MSFNHGQPGRTGSRSRFASILWPSNPRGAIWQAFHQLDVLFDSPISACRRRPSSFNTMSLCIALCSHSARPGSALQNVHAPHQGSKAICISGRKTGPEIEFNSDHDNWHAKLSHSVLTTPFFRPPPPVLNPECRCSPALRYLSLRAKRAQNLTKCKATQTGVRPGEWGRLDCGEFCGESPQGEIQERGHGAPQVICFHPQSD